jgi:hypothetical protein
MDNRRAHKSPQWRIGARWPRAGVPLPGFRRGAAAVTAVAAIGAVQGRGAPRKCRPRRRVLRAPRGALNWSLRRYVRASSLRVWLRRQAPEAGAASVSADRSGLLRTAGPRAGTVGEAGSPGPVNRAKIGSRQLGRALLYRSHRNRQMEHWTQAAASLRGGVRRGSAITPRECADAGGLVLTTLSSRVCVQSNIFKFVMT